VTVLKVRLVLLVLAAVAVVTLRLVASFRHVLGCHHAAGHVVTLWTGHMPSFACAKPSSRGRPASS
jgi:hypothetical protein